MTQVVRTLCQKELCTSPSVGTNVMSPTGGDGNGQNVELSVKGGGKSVGKSLKVALGDGGKPASPNVLGINKFSTSQEEVADNGGDPMVSGASTLCIC